MPPDEIFTIAFFTMLENAPLQTSLGRKHNNKIPDDHDSKLWEGEIVELGGGHCRTMLRPSFVT